MKNIICGYLDVDIDLSCDDEALLFPDQRVVLINWESLARETIAIYKETHTVEFELKEDEKGAHIIGHAGGDSIADLVTVNRTDTFRTVFAHQLDFIFGGVPTVVEKYKEEISKGLFVAALKIGEDIVILGIGNGLALEDGTTFDRRENGGEYVASLVSNENRQEAKTPLIYKPASEGDPIADFFDDFSNPPTP